MKVRTLDDQIVLSCAFRYALGRRTYVVSSVVKTILDNWEVLPETDQDRYKKEIREHKETYGNLGDDCDEEEWNRILFIGDL